MIRTKKHSATVTILFQQGGMSHHSPHRHEAKMWLEAQNCLIVIVYAAGLIVVSDVDPTVTSILHRYVKLLHHTHTCCTTASYHTVFCCTSSDIWSDNDTQNTNSLSRGGSSWSARGIPWAAGRIEEDLISIRLLFPPKPQRDAG